MDLKSNGPLVGWRSWEICEKLESDSPPFLSVSVTAPKLRVVSQIDCFISPSIMGFPYLAFTCLGYKPLFVLEQLKLLFQFQILRGEDLIESDSFKDQTLSKQEGIRVL